MSGYSCMPSLMAAIEYLPKKNNKKINKIMEKERKITAPEGCKIEKVELVDGVAVVTFKEKERKLPKSWEEFCEMYPIKKGECYIGGLSDIVEYESDGIPRVGEVSKNFLPDRATSEAVLALCQLIQLRNCYNGDWVPDWNKSTDKIVIDFCRDGDLLTFYAQGEVTLLAFKDKETADEFLRYFRPLIEKLKPLYGIKEGGKE